VLKHAFPFPDAPHNLVWPGIKKKGTTSCPFSPGFTRGSSNIALDLSSLAGTTTQIEQLGAANLALADNGDLLNEGAVDGEDTLNADTVGNAANGKGLCNAAVLLSNDGALESLDTLTLAFLDANVNADGIAWGFSALMLPSEIIFSASIFESSICF
jgi:hypothetical protein